MAPMAALQTRAFAVKPVSARPSRRGAVSVHAAAALPNDVRYHQSPIHAMFYILLGNGIKKKHLKISITNTAYLSVSDNAGQDCGPRW